MIITRSPLRISFLGGGTDISAFYKQEKSIIFGGAINQFVYVTSNRLSKFSEEKFRFTYRKTESVLQASDFQHPVVRCALAKFTDVQSINLATFSDIPGGTGLGSSSAFTVALLGNLRALTNNNISSKELALEAISIERTELKEFGGIQDQLHTAMGGLRFYELLGEEIHLSESFNDSEFFRLVNQSMLLVRVGQFRSSEQVHFSRGNIDFEILRKINNISRYFQRNFRENEASLDLLAECMNESWELKKRINSRITTNEIDEVINLGLKTGAQAAKLCGAGKSGFVLFIASPKVISELIKVFTENRCQKVEFIEKGFQIFRLIEESVA